MLCCAWSDPTVVWATPFYLFCLRHLSDSNGHISNISSNFVFGLVRPQLKVKAASCRVLSSADGQSASYIPFHMLFKIIFEICDGIVSPCSFIWHSSVKACLPLQSSVLIGNLLLRATYILETWFTVTSLPGTCSSQQAWGQRWGFSQCLRAPTVS